MAKRHIWQLAFIVIVISGVTIFMLLRRRSVETPSTKFSAENPVKVKVMLSWTPSAEHAFLYMGIRDGTFRKYGLDLEVIPSQGSSVVSKALEGGIVDFGFISGDTLVMSRVSGIRLKALVVLYHNSPATVYSLAEANIQNPIDLRGKRVGVLKKSTTYQQFHLLLKKEGIDPESIIEMPSRGSPAEVSERAVDAAMHYTQYAPVILRVRGKEVNEILFKDYGVDIVSTSLATTDKLISENSSLVRAFTFACLDSLHKSKDEEEKAVSTLVLAEPALDRKTTMASLIKANEYIFNELSKTRGVGYLSLDEWSNTQTTLYDGKQITTKINPAYFFDDSFFRAYQERGKP